MPGFVPNITEPLPCELPKPDPVIVTWVPAGPLVGETLTMEGPHAVTVRAAEPLTAPELAVIVVVPEVKAVRSPDELIVPTCVAAELQEAIFVISTVLPLTNVPVATNCCVVPVLREAFAGLTAMDANGGSTTKLAALLAAPPTVTTTPPLVAPLGTDTKMVVALQIKGVPVTPLKVTVFAP